MSESERQRPLTDLVGELVSDISGLFRSEIQLAKTEASEKVDHALGAAQGLAIGGVLAIGAVGVLLAALVTGLSWLLISLGMSQSAADFVAPLAVALITGGIAWMLISSSIQTWKAKSLNLNRTGRSLARDAAVVKESF